MSFDADALVIGAGPAGAAAAILLARAGWRVLLAEQHAYPRQKVCGECLTAGALAQLDALGVGPAIRRLAGPELQHVAWSGARATLSAAMPPCRDGPHRYGRALGRDHLDLILAERAAAVGVTRLQPVRVRTVHGAPGAFRCELEPSSRSQGPAGAPLQASSGMVRVPVVIDAHGSWETGPWQRPVAAPRRPRRGADLFGFKASFDGARLAPGVLPVLAFPGGYGGMVIADGGRLTLAGCIRRDTLGLWRSRWPRTPAGKAFELYLRRHCGALTEVLDGAVRSGPWMAVGPLRPGVGTADADGPFRIGNAAAEIHPLIGEGINMALESASILAQRLVARSPRALDAAAWERIRREVAGAQRAAFAPRRRLAALYAHLAMHPWLARPVTGLLTCHPPLLTRAARLAGKARGPFELPTTLEIPHEHA